MALMRTLSQGERGQEMRQFAALPYARRDGRCIVLLVTSRETRKWILPKGQPERNKNPCDVAAIEAFEEAGVRGKVAPKPFGEYRTTKRLANGVELPSLVEVYLLAVETVLHDWPERHERERCWVEPGEGAMMVSDGGLVEILLRFGALSD
jgi:8-oxo-dGTP pyrophosphatase MutT (NUDIX family)